MKLELPRVLRLKTGSAGIFSCEIPAKYSLLYKTILLKSPEHISVIIAPVKRHRSTGYKSANHHLNGHVQQICIETGNSFEDVKLYVKRQAFAQGLPFMTRLDGSPVLSLVDGQPLPISETDMDSIQCGWCIDAAHVLADDLGVVLEEE